MIAVVVRSPMGEERKWKCRAHISRWFPPYSRLFSPLSAFPLHALPIFQYAASIHLLHVGSSLLLWPLLSFIRAFVCPLISPSSPSPFCLSRRTHTRLYLQTSAGNLCTGAWLLCIRAHDIRQHIMDCTINSYCVHVL